jgi:hypothetical protein
MITWSLGIGVAEIPEEEQKDFLASVGNVISSWAIVESKLGELYLFTTGAHGVLVTPFHQSIEASYFAIMSFEGRLGMNTTAINFMPNVTDTLKKDWPTLANKISRRWKNRSLVAHSGIIGSCEHKLGRRIWLQPSPLVSTSVKRGKDDKPIRYFKQELDEFVISFIELAREIEKFRHRCFLAMTQQVSPSQAAHPPPAFHVKGGQTHTKPQGQRKSSGPKPSSAQRRARALAARKRKPVGK